MSTASIPTAAVPATRPWRRMLDVVTTPRPDSRPLPAGAFGRVAALWAVGRAVNLLVLLGWFEVSTVARWSFGPEGYRAGSFLLFLTGWDADRYGTIAESGYPLVLPTDEQGTVQPNNWAFLPVFPMLIRVLTEGTGLPWRLVAVALALGGGLLATWMLYLLLHHIASPAAAWAGTAVFTVAPMSFILVVGYSEGLFLALTFAALLLAIRRQYAWIVPIGIVLAFTRPGGLALPAALVLIGVARWMRRAEDPFPLAERVGLASAAIVTAVAGSAWPVIADAVTGVPHAYVRTETGWWLPSVGDFPFIPFTPWFRLADAVFGVGGIVLVFGVIALFVAALRSKGLKSLGGVVWAYTLAYGAYLLAVFLPQQSTFRILMPLAPLLADGRIVGTRRRRTVVIVSCLALQPVAVLFLWTIGNP